MRSSSDGSVPQKDEKLAAAALLAHPAVRLAPGRPDLHALLRDEVAANTGHMSVSGQCSQHSRSLESSRPRLALADGRFFVRAVCGSQGIARACRAALRVPLSDTLAGGPSVVLHVESFGYA